MKTTDYTFEVQLVPTPALTPRQAFIKTLIEAGERGEALHLPGEKRNRVKIQSSVHQALAKRGWKVHTQANGIGLFVWCERWQPRMEKP